MRIRTQRPPTHVRDAPASVDVKSLATALRHDVNAEVRFDSGSRALYATDASNYRQAPIGVVVPRDVDAIVQTVALCRRFGAPVLPRGGGTSLAGQCCNAAVVIDTSKYLREVLEVDTEKRWARVQPGVVLDDLRNAAEKYHLTFGPDPATHDRNTLGGMIGNNSCGVHSVMAGLTADNIEELEILTYDGLRLRVGPTSETVLTAIIQQGGRKGEIYSRLVSLRDLHASRIRERYPKIPRCVSGYGLPHLLPENGFNVAAALVGSEGTCVTVLEATTKLVHSPPDRVLVVLGYPDIYRACDQIDALIAHRPVGLEGFDDILVRDLHKKGKFLADLSMLPDGGGWLLVEFGGESKEDAEQQGQSLINALMQQAQPPNIKLFRDREQQQRVWKVRESALGAAAIVPGQPAYWPGWEDSAVPPARMGDYLRELRSLMERYQYGGSFYGHFGQGCLHTRMSYDLVTQAGIDAFNAFIADAADLVLRYGGSLSGEHGDGQARAELLPKMFGPELVEAFREFKSIWDPAGKMNPGKVVDPYPIVSNLRLGTDYSPLQLSTHFSFPDDDGSFAKATLRCVGIGKCRRESGGTMCPSYMVTHEEADTTRGRARLLFEMLDGKTLHDGWRDDAVRDALDLCLACKGCKSDCPVSVDMATYKAEFLSHYYEGRRQPVTAYSMGLITWWARLAEHAPWLANFVTQTPLLRDGAKLLGGIAPQRQIPVFAPQTLKQWFRGRAPQNADKPAVLLWPDTFNNHFHPQVGRAAVEVLEAAGFRVELPGATLCCGRPLYDFGMLGLAERWLQEILEALRPQIRAGMPLVGLEPSCIAVFRDELINLFPNDEDARRLSRQSYLLSEFLQQKAADFEFPRLDAKALVHGHCHHKAIMGLEDEEKLLSRVGIEYTVPDDGCCGMAGSFGFEKKHYGVSVAIGERVLLPAVRDATAETLIITDGFSCREQIAQTTDRRAFHLAEVLYMALHPGAEPASGEEQPATQPPVKRLTAALAVGSGLALAGGTLWWKLHGTGSK